MSSSRKIAIIGAVSAMLFTPLFSANAFADFLYGDTGGPIVNPGNEISSNSLSVVDYYGYSSFIAHTPDGLEHDNERTLLISMFSGTDGLSLFFLIDDVDRTGPGISYADLGISVQSSSDSNVSVSDDYIPGKSTPELLEVSDGYFEGKWGWSQLATDGGAISGITGQWQIDIWQLNPFTGIDQVLLITDGSDNSNFVVTAVDLNGGLTLMSPDLIPSPGTPVPLPAGIWLLVSSLVALRGAGKLKFFG